MPTEVMIYFYNNKWIMTKWETRETNIQKSVYQDSNSSTASHLSCVWSQQQVNRFAHKHSITVTNISIFLLLLDNEAEETEYILLLSVSLKNI